MGSDDIFKKRKARNLKDQQRKIGVRKVRDKVLIVCEGEQTEPLSTKPFYATGKNSAAYNVIETLKDYLPSYEKNKNVFDELKKYINTAIKNAEIANKSAAQIQNNNPSTKVVELVKYLINLSNN